MSVSAGIVIDFASFTSLAGRRVRSPRKDGTAESPPFRFRDDVWYLWNLLRPREQDSCGNIVFSDVPP
jgi:hypothetical protein